jgi:threonine dehydrogenase-like Zn-dependent dehydrogenase
LNIARPGGRVLLFAQNDPTMQIEFPAAAVGVEEKEILGSYSAAVDLHVQAAGLVFKHHDLFGELISHRFELESIAQAFAMASQPADNSLKLMVLP